MGANEPDLLGGTAHQLDALGIAPREVALDGGFAPAPSAISRTAVYPEEVA